MAEETRPETVVGDEQSNVGASLGPSALGLSNRPDLVRLFGEELELVRPMGILGLQFMPKAHRAFRRLAEIIGPAEKRMSQKGISELKLTAEMLGLIDELITTEEFLTDVLPGFFVYSKQRLTKQQAMDKINAQPISTETTVDIFMAFMNAMRFWGQSDQPEALEMALKK